MSNAAIWLPSPNKRMPQLIWLRDHESQISGSRNVVDRKQPKVLSSLYMDE